jgi:hypothetical protein
MTYNFEQRKYLFSAIYNVTHDKLMDVSFFREKIDGCF